MMSQRRRRWPLKQHWLNRWCKCLLGPSKKRISPMNCLSRFSCSQRMEAEYYKDIIITWMYLHRYRSRDTDTWWCTTLCFLGRWEDRIVFLQICKNMMQSSQQTRGIHPILFQCWANDGDAGQHWNSIGWMPCVCWAVSLCWGLMHMRCIGPTSTLEDLLTQWTVYTYSSLGWPVGCLLGHA